MWHKFPQPFRNVIRKALLAARQQGRAAAEPRDFLRAIAHEPDCAAAQILKRLRHVPSVEPLDAAIEPANALAPDAKKLIEQAYEESALLKDRLVGSDHLLLAMTKLDLVPELHGNGVKYARVRREVKRFRSWGHAPDAPPPPKPIRLHTALAHRVKRFIAGAKDLYKVYAQLSVVHPRFVTDPYPLYHKLRAINPVRRDPLLPAWIVTGYDEVTKVMRDARFSSEPRSKRTRSGTMEVDFLPDGPVRKDLCVIANVLTRQMVFMDPPKHAKIRNQLGTVFSPKNVASLRPRVQQTADELIDACIARGRMDFIQDFAYPLPLLVAAELMGFHKKDKVMLKRWSDVFASMLSFSTTIREDLHARQCMLEMRQYFDAIIAELRARPNDTLLSHLITPRDGTEPIDQDDLFGNCVFLLAAGHETTTSVMGSGLLALLKHPDQLAKIRDDESLVPNAVEELLRFESPVQWTSRRAKENLELAGQRIAANDMVMICMGAANRDPRQFPEPDRLDLTRANASKNLAFSGGNHYCLGAGLARIELQVGLTTMLKRLPNLRVEPGFKVTWRKGTTLHSFESLPVLFDPPPAERRAAVAPAAPSEDATCDAAPPAATASATSG